MLIVLFRISTTTKEKKKKRWNNSIRVIKSSLINQFLRVICVTTVAFNGAETFMLMDLYFIIDNEKKKISSIRRRCICKLYELISYTLYKRTIHANYFIFYDSRHRAHFTLHVACQILNLYTTKFWQRRDV